MTVHHNVDHLARADLKESPPAAIFWIVASSYMYYHRYESLLSDTCFDNMCKYVLTEFDNLEHTLYSELIDKESMEAGSLYKLSEADYPEGLKRMAERALNALQGGNWP